MSTPTFQKIQTWPSLTGTALALLANELPHYPKAKPTFTYSLHLEDFRDGAASNFPQLSLLIFFMLPFSV